MLHQHSVSYFTSILTSIHQLNTDTYRVQWLERVLTRDGDYIDNIIIHTLIGSLIIS